MTLPRLSDAQLAPWYHENYHGRGEGSEKSLFSAAMELFTLFRVRSLKRYLRSGMTVIDYGAGEGRFVKKLAARGIAAYGVEHAGFRPLDPDGPVRSGTVVGSLDELVSMGIVPDMVTLWHVVEHLADPWRNVRAIVESLKKNGLVVAVAPNLESAQARVTGSHWYHLDPPRHRWHFSEGSLRALLEQSGLEILECRQFDPEFAPVGWWQSLLNGIHCGSGFPVHQVKRGKSRTARQPPCAKLFDALSTGLAGGFLLPLSLVFSVLEAAGSMGGSTLCIGRKP